MLKVIVDVQKLNPLLHSELRLAVMSILVGVGDCLKSKSAPSED